MKFDAHFLETKKEREEGNSTDSNCSKKKKSEVSFSIATNLYQCWISAGNVELGIFIYLVLLRPHTAEQRFVLEL